LIMVSPLILWWMKHQRTFFLLHISMHLSDVSLGVTIGLSIQVWNLYSMIMSENVRVHPTQKKQSEPQNENHKWCRLIIPHEHLPHCGKCRHSYTKDQQQ
jgi:hypothetical protein